MTLTISLIAERLVYAYVFSGHTTDEDITWVKSKSHEWVGSLLEANGEDRAGKLTLRPIAVAGSGLMVLLLLVLLRWRFARRNSVRFPMRRPEQD